MQHNNFQKLLILTLLLELVSAYLKDIFPHDMCNITCGRKKRIHTFCGDSIVPCETFQLYDMQNRNNYKDILTIGHNGLRSRIAEKLNIANMLFMRWDDNLSLMADNYHKYCKPYKLDRCTKFKSNIGPLIDLDTKYATASYAHIVMNNFFINKHRATEALMQSVLRFWYKESRDIKAPVWIQVNETNYIRLIGENNFTHMTYPHVYKFGCSYAQFFNGLSIMCYYFPYYRSKKFEVYYREKSEGSIIFCPYKFPLQHSKYPKLCTYAEVQDGANMKTISQDFGHLCAAFVLILTTLQCKSICWLKSKM